MVCFFHPRNTSSPIDTAQCAGLVLHSALGWCCTVLDDTQLERDVIPNRPSSLEQFHSKTQHISTEGLDMELYQSFMV